MREKVQPMCPKVASGIRKLSKKASVAGGTEATLATTGKAGEAAERSEQPEPAVLFAY